MKTSSLIKSALPVLGLSLVPIINTSAITYQNSANVEFTFNPTITVSLSSPDLTIANLAPGSTSDSNVITATVSTNAGYGYYLSATTGSAGGNTNLTNTADSTYTFANLSSNAATLSAIPDNKWGYSYSTDNGTTWISGDNGSALSGYNGLPLDADDSGATGVKLLSSDSFAGTGSVQFKIGARASSDQAAGTYTGTVNFYAVTNPAPLPYMQDMTSAKLDRLLPIVGDVTTLYDKRDEQAYQIAKLADGKYWMVENLNLAGETALSADDTNVTSEYISNFTTSNNLTKEGDTIKLPTSSTSGFNIDNYSYVYNSGNKTNCGTSGQNTRCYSYYSWDAATLGSGRNIGTDNTNAEQSICPKGWKLPSTYNDSGAAAETTDFRKLIISYGGSNSIQIYTSITTPTGATLYGYIGPTTTPNFLLAGYYTKGLFVNGGSYGYYWSSTSYSDDIRAEGLSFNSDSVHSPSNGYRSNGISVRCLFSDQ